MTGAKSRGRVWREGMAEIGGVWIANRREATHEASGDEHSKGCGDDSSRLAVHAVSYMRLSAVMFLVSCSRVIRSYVRMRAGNYAVAMPPRIAAKYVAACVVACVVRQGTVTMVTADGDKIGPTCC